MCVGGRPVAVPSGSLLVTVQQPDLSEESIDEGL